MQDDRAKPETTGRGKFRPFLVPAPHGRAATHDAPRSSPRLRAQVDWLDAEERIAELLEDQVLLSMKVAGLERVIAAPAVVRPEPSPHPALVRLEAHVRALGDVRNQLATMLVATSSFRVFRAFLPDAPLAEYLESVHGWSLAIAHALEKLALGIHTRRPDLAAFARRAETANNLHFDLLEDDVRRDLRLLDPAGEDPTVRSLAAAFEELLAGARRLEEQLEQDV